VFDRLEYPPFFFFSLKKKPAGEAARSHTSYQPIKHIYSDRLQYPTFQKKKNQRVKQPTHMFNTSLSNTFILTVSNIHVSKNKNRSAGEAARFVGLIEYERLQTLGIFFFILPRKPIAKETFIY